MAYKKLWRSKRWFVIDMILTPLLIIVFAVIARRESKNW